MKLLKELNAEIDAIEASNFDNIEINSDTSHVDLIAVFGLLAPVAIKILEVWKKVPGRKKETRNKRLDKWIAAFTMAAIISSVKFKV